MPESTRLDWLYRYTTNDAYPDPVEEIDFLCTLDDVDEPTFLLLADRASPPLSGGACGEVVGLCTSRGNRLILHGTAVVAGNSIRGSTPPSVQPIYGNLKGRVFCPLQISIRAYSWLPILRMLKLIQPSKEPAGDLNF
jgi:hypothetical protein